MPIREIRVVETVLRRATTPSFVHSAEAKEGARAASRATRADYRPCGFSVRRSQGFARLCFVFQAAPPEQRVRPAIAIDHAGRDEPGAVAAPDERDPIELEQLVFPVDFAALPGAEPALGNAQVPADVALFDL